MVADVDAERIKFTAHETGLNCGIIGQNSLGVLTCAGYDYDLERFGREWMKVLTYSSEYEPTRFV